MCKMTAAHGCSTVCSTTRPECHAPSGYSVRDYSGANGSRDRQRDMILAFWEAQGIARWQGDIANGGGSRWYVLDVLGDGVTWLPLARQDETGRADRAELSHVVSAANGGAWCACGILPERGNANHARGDQNMTAHEMTDLAHDVLAAWPAWWEENVARKASLKRLSA